jgi:hypothetical protein
MRAWAFEHEPQAIRTALAEITASHEDAVLGDADFALIACWTLNDREFPGGGTLAQRYADRPDLSVDEADTARRIAAARPSLLRVVDASPGHWIDLDDIVRKRQARVMSHGVSRTVRKDEMLVARIMEGPPAQSLWGPVATLTRESGRQLMDLLKARITSSSLQDSPAGLATAMHLAAREITTLLAPGLTHRGEIRAGGCIGGSGCAIRSSLGR